jgi:hypothetical protein
MAQTQTRTTTRRDEIREWAEKCGGVPASVAGTEKGGEAGVLRFRFREDADDKLQEISWDEFFEKFDKEQLALVYQDGDAESCDSRFFKLVDRRRAH